jgi:hypothetical protein
MIDLILEWGPSCGAARRDMLGWFQVFRLPTAVPFEWGQIGGRYPSPGGSEYDCKINKRAKFQ